MPFMMSCTNKGCGKTQTPYLDTTSNEVYCADCGNTISNVTHFAKMQMKALGQTMKSGGRRQAYAQRCLSCKTEDVPKLVEDNLVCAKCSKKLDNISKPFELIIKKALKENKEEDQ